MGDLTALTNAVIQGDLNQVQTILDENRELVHQQDETGATALHYATLKGCREIVQLLLDKGAEINKADGQFGATPTGWAIEYLREQGGCLGIELDDFAYAIEQGDARWAARFLKRFPTLRQGINTKGKPFRQLAEESGNPAVIALFRNT
ncbi:MAG: ankyrin repeat domain-containing protein [Candidatus Acidiferrum sp.]